MTYQVWITVNCSKCAQNGLSLMTAGRYVPRKRISQDLDEMGWKRDGYLWLCPTCQENNKKRERHDSQKKN